MNVIRIDVSVDESAIKALLSGLISPSTTPAKTTPAKTTPAKEPPLIDVQTAAAELVEKNGVEALTKKILPKYKIERVGDCPPEELASLMVDISLAIGGGGK